MQVGLNIVRRPITRALLKDAPNRHRKDRAPEKFAGCAYHMLALPEPSNVT